MKTSFDNRHDSLGYVRSLWVLLPVALLAVTLMGPARAVSTMVDMEGLCRR